MADLPGQLDAAPLKDVEFLGELSLSGELRPVRGALPAALKARKAGRALLVPLENADEAALVSGVTILGAGATACAALAALRETGLESATVLVRDRARAGDLLAAAGRLGMEVDLRPFDSEVRDGDLLVSTVPAGAAGPAGSRSVRTSRPPRRRKRRLTRPPWGSRRNPVARRFPRPTTELQPIEHMFEQVQHNLEP